MSTKKQKIFSKALVAAMIAALVVLFWYGVFENTNRGTKLSHEALTDWNEGWQFQGNHTISMPFKTQWIKHQQIYFENIIPDNVQDGWALGYTSNYAVQKVFVGGELVYTYGEKAALPFGSMTGNIMVVVPLRAADAGKTIRIAVTPMYNAEFEMHGMMLGQREGILLEILETNMWHLVAIPLLLLLAFLTLCLGLYHNFTSERNHHSIMFYFTLFVTNLAVWLFSSSSLPQFFTDANVAMCIASFFSLAVLPVAFCGMCKNLFHKEAKAFQVLQWLCYANIFMQMLLYVLDVSDPMGMLGFTHAMLIFTIVLTLAASIRNLRQGKEARVLFGLIVFFILVCIGALISFYKNPGSRNDGVVMGIGMIIFSLGILFMLESMELADAREVLKSVLYRKMAYTDALTGLGNRSALERDTDELMDTLADGKRVVYIMGDLNRLKYTNDTYGHDAGDTMIRDAGMCIRNAIPPEAHCYRLGGDEFGVLLAGSELNAWYLIDKIEEEMAQYNKSHEIELSMAIGSATAAYRRDETGFFQELAKKADDQMYEVKRKQHMARQMQRPES